MAPSIIFSNNFIFDTTLISSVVSSSNQQQQISTTKIQITYLGFNNNLNLWLKVLLFKSNRL